MTELQPFENSNFGSVCNSFYFGAANWANPKFSSTITQSFLKSKFMKKSVDIENCNGSLKMQKCLKNKFGKIFKKIFENRRF